jgi:hypothetical protein
MDEYQIMWCDKKALPVCGRESEESAEKSFPDLTCEELIWQWNCII